MSFLRVLVFCALSVTVLSQSARLYYYCVDDSAVSGNWIMDMFLETGAPVAGGDVHAVILPEGVNSTGSTCSNLPANDTSQEITGNGTDVDPYKLVVEVNATTGFLVPSSQTCGYAHNNSSPNAVYEWGIQVHTVAGLPDQNRLLCDFDNAALTETRSVSSIVDIVVDSPSPVVELEPAVKLSIVHGSTLQPLNKINTLDVKLKVEFRTGRQYWSDVPDATGVFPHTCFICDTVDCSPSGSLVNQFSDENGCPVGSVFSTTGFTGDGVTLYSSALNLAFLLDSNIQFAYFRCSDEYCTTATTNNRCKDSCLNSRRKKKRDVEHVLSKRNYLQSDRLNSQGSSNSQPRLQVRSKCQANSGFVITMATLASIFALAMLISIVQCLRLFSLRKQ